MTRLPQSVAMNAVHVALAMIENCPSPESEPMADRVPLTVIPRTELPEILTIAVRLPVGKSDIEPDPLIEPTPNS